MKLGFIGYGNMATAIIDGLQKKRLKSVESIAVYDHLEERRQRAIEKGLTVSSNIQQLVIGVDMIIICVKPKDYTILLHELNIASDKPKVYLSIAAGVTIRSMEKELGVKTPIVRAMPNTPLLVGAGTTAICRNGNVSEEVYAFAKDIFSAAGTVYELAENQLDDAINLNGSAPAYIFLIAKTAARFAEESGGIAYETALSMFCDTLKGSAEMMQHSGKSVERLISDVSSPGGTTVAALESFKESWLERSLRLGFEAAVQRAKEMGNG